MKLTNKQFSNLKILSIGNKDIYIVDHHQYTLPIWAMKSLTNKTKYVLVSIDYHPDTNPSFWLSSFQQAMAIDPMREDELTTKFQQRKLDELNRDDVDDLIQHISIMRNDEHINTAMYLNYLSDYHMINCMELHQYNTGHHYLVEEDNFGSLEDAMFCQIKFTIPEEKLILDIDLDYFLLRTDLDFVPEKMTTFKELVKRCEFITIARSDTYFDYLKRENFSLEECEQLLLNLLQKLLTE